MHFVSLLDRKNLIAGGLHWLADLKCDHEQTLSLLLGQDCFRDGHDTDTNYRYCRYLRVGGKCRYIHQVSLVFDTESALFRGGPLDILGGG